MQQVEKYKKIAKDCYEIRCLKINIKSMCVYVCEKRTSQVL